jgi:hypothetical protein
MTSDRVVKLRIFCFFVDMFTKEWIKGIQTNNFRFMRHNLQPIKVPLENAWSSQVKLR